MLSCLIFIEDTKMFSCSIHAVSCLILHSDTNRPVQILDRFENLRQQGNKNNEGGKKSLVYILSQRVTYWAPKRSIRGTDPGMDSNANKDAMAIIAALPFAISTVL